MNENIFLMFGILLIAIFLVSMTLSYLHHKEVWNNFPEEEFWLRIMEIEKMQQKINEFEEENQDG